MLYFMLTVPHANYVSPSPGLLPTCCESLVCELELGTRCLLFTSYVKSKHEITVKALTVRAQVEKRGPMVTYWLRVGKAAFALRQGDALKQEGRTAK